MSEYKTRKINFFNEIDEIGSKYSLTRLRGEDTASFQERIMHQCRSGMSAKIEDIGSFLNNSLGLTEAPMLEIKKAKDANGEELYPYSCIRIDACDLIIVKDVFKEEELKFKYRDSLDFSEIKQYINSTGVFDCIEVYGANINEYDSAYKLKCETNLKYKDVAFVEKKKVDTGIENIMYFDLNLNERAYNKVDTFEEVVEEGDYCFNRLNGELLFFDKTTASLSVGYADFPFFLKKQNIKISSCKDESFNSLIKNNIVENEKQKRIELNEKGIEFYNELFKSFSNHWDV